MFRKVCDQVYGSGVDVDSDISTDSTPLHKCVAIFAQMLSARWQCLLDNGWLNLEPGVRARDAQQTRVSAMRMDGVTCERVLSRSKWKMDRMRERRGCSTCMCVAKAGGNADLSLHLQLIFIFSAHWKSVADNRAHNIMRSHCMASHHW